MYEEEEYREAGRMARVGRVIKGILISLIFVLAGLLFFRFWLNGYYPASMRTLLSTAPLSEAVREGEMLHAKTQEIQVSYDDPKEGLFFAGHMVFVEETGSLQVTVRWNLSTLNRIETKYPSLFDPDADEPFSFRLFAANEAGEETIVEDKETIRGDKHSPVASEDAGFAMYRYERLAFEGVTFHDVPWMRLEIYLADGETYLGDIVVYENHEKYNEFTDYVIGEGELS